MKIEVGYLNEKTILLYNNIYYKIIVSNIKIPVYDDEVFRSKIEKEIVNDISEFNYRKGEPHYIQLYPYLGGHLQTQLTRYIHKDTLVQIKSFINKND